MLQRSKRHSLFAFAIGIGGVDRLGKPTAVADGTVVSQITAPLVGVDHAGGMRGRLAHTTKDPHGTQDTTAHRVTPLERAVDLGATCDDRRSRIWIVRTR